MASDDRKIPERRASATSSSPSASSSSSSTSSSLPSASSSFTDNLKERLLIPTFLAGIAGGGVGLVSKHRANHPNISATYATNFAVVAGCYCGAREFARVTRNSGQDDLMNSAIGGFFSGALLGRLQAGQRGAFRYSIIFALVGTTVDYATLRAKPMWDNFQNSDWLKLPEWSPIKVLDEEALAKKKAQEKLFAERALGKLNKEDS